MKDQNLRSHMDRNHDQIAKSNSRQNLELHPHQQQISSSPPDNQPQPVPRNRHAPQAARDTPPHRDQDQDTIKRPTNGGQSHPHSRQHSGKSTLWCHLYLIIKYIFRRTERSSIFTRCCESVSTKPSRSTHVSSSRP